MNVLSPFLVGTALSGLLIVFGFLALLAQKIYIQKEGAGQASEVELPWFGKMKTNYPALIFVLFGVALAVYSLKIGQDAKTEPWEIDATPVTPSTDIDWQEAKLVVFPRSIDLESDAATGKQTIRLQIDPSKSFEDVVERIQFTHKSGGSATIYPKEELRKKEAGQKSNLTSTSSRTRSYSVTLGSFPTK